MNILTRQQCASFLDGTFKKKKKKVVNHELISRKRRGTPKVRVIQFKGVSVRLGSSVWVLRRKHPATSCLLHKHFSREAVSNKFTWFHLGFTFIDLK